MPANLTPEYRKADQAFREAKGDEERIVCLEEMLRTLPKHKGTEKMQADLKARISRMRKNEQKARAAKKAEGHFVEKQGAGQVVLAGAANAGKSRLLTALTSATADVAEYPFTTQRAYPGMMRREDVQVQLVDMPAIAEEFMPTWVPDMIRRADMALLVADLSSDDVVEQTQAVIDRLAAVKLILCESPPREQAPDDRNTYRRALLGANKIDAPGAAERLDILMEMLEVKLPAIKFSAETGEGLEELRSEIWRRLNKIRVYSKVPGKPADMNEPFVLPAGSSVMDLAEEIHKELAESLTRARIWGKDKYDGQFVRRDAILSDGDVVELHE